MVREPSRVDEGTKEALANQDLMLSALLELIKAIAAMNVQQPTASFRSSSKGVPPPGALALVVALRDISRGTVP